MKADVEKVGAGIVAASGKDLPGPLVHSRVIQLAFHGGAEKVGHVPHRNRENQAHSAVEDPVVHHGPRSGLVPEVDRERNRQTRKSGVDQRRQPQLAPSHNGLNLGAVGPAGNVDEIVRCHYEKLHQPCSRKRVPQRLSDKSIIVLIHGRNV